MGEVFLALAAFLVYRSCEAIRYWLPLRASPDCCLSGSGTWATRKPRLLDRDVGLYLPQRPNRQFPALQYQLLPQYTRNEPFSAPVGFSAFAPA